MFGHRVKWSVLDYTVLCSKQMNGLTEGLQGDLRHSFKEVLKPAHDLKLKLVASPRGGMWDTRNRKWINIVVTKKPVVIRNCIQSLELANRSTAFFLKMVRLCSHQNDDVQCFYRNSQDSSSITCDFQVRSCR